MLSLELVRRILGWCIVFDFGLLLVWFFFIALFNDFVYKIHFKWFKISKESFHKIHYSGMFLLKIIVIVFFVIPYLVLLVVGR